MKAIISLAIFLMATLTAWADSAKDRWTVYQSYSNITEIEPAGTVCFVLASNSVYSYDTTDGLVQTYDKAGVMSDVGVSHIAWAKASKRLVVVYTNSNIDLLSANGDVINAPDFYLKTTTLDKTINHIDFDGPYAYLSTAFGVVKLNTRDGAIMDTYDLGTNVSYTYVKNGYLYAESKERGRLRCKLTDNLLDKSNWVREDGFTTLREDRTNVQDAQTKLWWTKTADGKSSRSKRCGPCSDSQIAAMRRAKGSPLVLSARVSHQCRVLTVTVVPSRRVTSTSRFRPAVSFSQQSAIIAIASTSS